MHLRQVVLRLIGVAILPRVQPPDWGDWLLLPFRARAQQVQMVTRIAHCEGACRLASKFGLANSEPGEMGAIGCYSQRYIANPKNLVIPRKPEDGPVDSFGRYQPEWLIAGWHRVSAALAQMPWFQTLHQPA